MSRITKWITGFYKENYSNPKYILISTQEAERLRNSSYGWAKRVLCFNTSDEVNDWLDNNVAKVDRENYILYELSNLKEKGE